MKTISIFLLIVLLRCSYSFGQPASAKSQTQFLVNNWCFQYKYDSRKRVTHKKIPGADWVYNVYDSRDRLVLTQDGNQRLKNIWSFTKYDEFNRIVFTGVRDTTVALTQQQMQSVVDKFYLAQSSNYSSNSYPKVINPQQYLTINYYDDYSWLTSISDSSKFSFNAKDLAGQVTNNFKRVSGLPTGKKLKVRDGAGGTSTWLLSVMYYDDKQHVVQTVSELFKGDVQRTTNVYDFKGKIIATKTTVGKDYTTRWFAFDPSGRLKTITHQYRDGAKVMLVSNEYNELGQLTNKKLHATDDGMSGKQDIVYQYNIRGWTSSINSELFASELLYNNKQPDVNNQSFYNGNISSISWKNVSEQNAFKYEYDPMNRIRLAQSVSPSFDQSRYKYDLNGNIQALVRNDQPGSIIDNLTYDFGKTTSKSNQLLKVTDGGDRNKGFIDVTNSDNDFSYDANGNMIVDQNKKITITYTELNLPACVTKSTAKLCFAYDASGKKLSQTTFNNGTAVKRVDYCNDFEYENGILRSINTEEGRVSIINSKPEYQYHLKDHLGNVRSTFTSTPGFETKTASLESDSSSNDRSAFLRYDLARKVQSALFDHTNDKNTRSTNGYSQRLNGSANERIGLAKSLSVMPGDMIKAEVFAKFVDPRSTNWKAPLVSLMNYLALPASAPVGMINDGSGYSTSATTPLGITAINHASGNTTGPKAYLNYIFINREFSPLSIVQAFIQIPETAYEDGSDRPHAKLELSKQVTEPGYVYIYLSNDNPTPVDVFFDDFKVENAKSPLISFQDYDPFGVVFNNYERENTIPERTKFQGQEHIGELDLNWDSFKWRNHQPELGRFFNIDPLAEKYYHNSPYAFSENKVTAHVELEGLESVYVFDQANRPKDNGEAGKGYTADIYVLGLDGSVNGPYKGSSYPNSVSPTDNRPAGNTLNAGEHSYNNLSGHKNGTKQGLNVVDEDGNRVAPGTAPDGSSAAMTVVNVHKGFSDVGGYQSRGSNGCITIKPGDAAGFFSNFDWSGQSGKTGNSNGTITVYRGASGESTLQMSTLDLLKSIKEMLDQQHKDANKNQN